MDNQPSFDRSLLIPIGVGIFAVLGICLILASGRLNETHAVVQEVPTSTAFQYAFIGTEPAFTTVTLEPSEEASPTGAGLEETLPPEIFDTPTIAPQDTPVNPPNNTPNIIPTNTLASLITLPPIANTSTPSRTPTSAFAAPFGPGTFDDVDSRFVYSGDWDRQSNVAGATGGTLHVSGTLGNSVKFLFIGNELRVFFQAGPSLGTIRLTLDTTSYVMNEASTSTQSYEWVLAASTTGTHTVSITHDSGGSVTFDAIIVPVVPATATNTTTGQ
jgi:hypothetical protein